MKSGTPKPAADHVVMDISRKTRKRHSSDAMARYGKPEIFNIDQGSQFTSLDFTAKLKDAEIKISTDERGRWIDNRFIERLWRSLKYECPYLNAFEAASNARNGIDRWIKYYNGDRPHSIHNGLTPNEGYEASWEGEKLAA